MAKRYDPETIEKKWQQKWEKKPLFQAVDFAPKPKFYALVEFPYPSGQGIHLGHAFTMTILDIFARKKRADGFNVLYPMGWDAFGLPTENYAIRTGIHPAVATKKNTDRFRQQMKRLGFSYNWEREIKTSDPEYYRWTQWIFIQFFKHGLAYKAAMPVGWCPACKIVLANEEIVDGRCERCGHQAERRLQSQWLLRITAYADRLAAELDLVDYPDYVKEAQRHWIGRTEGINIFYPVIGRDDLTLACYSTRPETNFGATFIVIAPEHPLVLELTTKDHLSKVKKYINQAKKKSELERTELAKEKTGVFTGSYALNRLTGRKMPIWVSDFVILTAGTGVVVGVPAHDERDFAFAQKYGLEIIPVLRPASGRDWDFQQSAYTDLEGAVVFNSDFLNGLPAQKAKEKIIAYLVKKGWGERAVNYHLRDWIFSRQHYWGEPIPMVYCPACAKKGISWWDTEAGKKFKKTSHLTPEIKNSLKGWFPVPEDQLPVKLPKVKRYQPTDSGESPLANVSDWVTTKCPVCGGPARRETDTMPNWAGSSWYYLRYCDPHNQKNLADYRKLKYWLPVDLYLGGAEHTTLHLLYSRFWHKFLNDIGVAPGKEPYAARRQHGVILAEDGRRMSKSRGNVINPEDVVQKFGADTLRLYLMFLGPYEATMPWSSQGVEGCYRFLGRIWRLYQITKWPAKTAPELLSALHRLIKKVGEDIDSLKYNTAIAAMMEFVNQWTRQKTLSRDDAGLFLRVLAPFAPFISEELWQKIARSSKSKTQAWSLHQQPWPKFDPQLIQEETVTIIIQVNGKVRGQIRVKNQAAEAKDQVEKLAQKEENVARYLQGKKVRKVVFVPGKLINFVVSA